MKSPYKVSAPATATDSTSVERETGHRLLVLLPPNPTPPTRPNNLLYDYDTADNALLYSTLLGSALLCSVTRQAKVDLCVQCDCNPVAAVCVTATL